MAKIAFEWSDAWAYYPYALPETQKDILIALEATLKSVSPAAQVKALEAAPMTVIKSYAHLLHDRAKKVLGLEASTKKTQVKNWSW